MPSQNQPRSEFGSWQDVESAANRVAVQSPDSFSPETTQNVHDLFNVIPCSCPLPIEVTKGYWSTVRIIWAAAEIEIFDDRYELYRFGRDKMAIEYFQRPPGTDVPLALIDRLPGEGEDSS